MHTAYFPPDIFNIQRKGVYMRTKLDCVNKYTTNGNFSTITSSLRYNKPVFWVLLQCVNYLLTTHPFHLKGKYDLQVETKSICFQSS